MNIGITCDIVLIVRMFFILHTPTLNIIALTNTYSLMKFDFVYASSQWEMTLDFNTVSHWLDAYT